MVIIVRGHYMTFAVVAIPCLLILKQTRTRYQADFACARDKVSGQGEKRRK